jgi:Alpha/beta hydrolase domain
LSRNRVICPTAANPGTVSLRTAAGQGVRGHRGAPQRPGQRPGTPPTLKLIPPHSGTHGYPYDAVPTKPSFPGAPTIDLAHYGYAQKEFLMSGTTKRHPLHHVTAQTESMNELKAWDPVRYAALGDSGDGQSYDIFTQAAQVVRADRQTLLGGLDPVAVPDARRLRVRGQGRRARRPGRRVPDQVRLRPGRRRRREVIGPLTRPRRGGLMLA